MRAPHEHPADPLLVARIFAAALGRPLRFSGAGNSLRSRGRIGRPRQGGPNPAHPRRPEIFGGCP